MWYLIVLGVLLLLLSAGVYFNLSHTLHRELDEDLRARAAQMISIRNIMGIVERGRFEENIGEIVAFYYRRGNRLIHLSPRDQTLPVSAELADKVIEGERLMMTLATSDGTTLRIFGVPYKPRPMDRIPPPPDFRGPPPRHGPPSRHLRDIDAAALFIARPTAHIERALSGLLITLMFAVPLTLIISGAGGVFLARRVLNPIKKITDTAHTIGESDLSRRIDVHTNDELGRLSGTLNEMIERLEKAFERQRQFTGDASHELRTPLAVIEAESTLALQRDRSSEEYKQSLSNVAREAEHMAAIIDQLLSLARADAGMEAYDFEELNLDEVIESVVSKTRGRCEEKKIALTTQLQSGAKIKGGHAMLKLLFSNLLDNAIRYTQSGGSITVSLGKEAGKANIEVKDTGIGIPAGDLPHIFERFYRVDKVRSRGEGGSGLGLSICRQIAEIHGGSIDVVSQAGRGSAFRVTLPIIS